MPFVMTRFDVIRQAARDGGTKQDLDDVDKLSDYRHAAVTEWRLSYERMLLNKHAGVGRATRTIAVLAESETFDLPPEFRALHGWTRSDLTSGMTPVHVTDLAALQHRWLDGSEQLPQEWLQGAYYLEGGGVDESGVTVARRVRILPKASSAITVTIVYVTQAPSFGDPNDAADDAVAIDFQVVDAYEMTVAGVRARVSSRGDGKEEQKSLGRWAQSLDLTLKRMVPDQHRGVNIESMLRIGGRPSY